MKKLRQRQRQRHQPQPQHQQLKAPSNGPQLPAPTALNERVHCGVLIRERLLPETIALANAIVEEILAHARPHVSDDDGTGLLVQVLDRDKLHAALALPGAPVKQRHDATASTELFCEWLVSSALETPEVKQLIQTMTGHRDGQVVAVGLYRLTLQEANRIVYTQWQQPMWVLAMRESGIAPFALVLCVASGDLITMYEPVHVFD